MIASKAGSYPCEAPLRCILQGWLLALPTNIRQGWKFLPLTSTLTYYEHQYITAAESFISLDHEKHRGVPVVYIKYQTWLIIFNANEKHSSFLHKSTRLQSFVSRIKNKHLLKGKVFPNVPSKTPFKRKSLGLYYKTFKG